jgi:thiamine pyrophosphokinase
VVIHDNDEDTNDMEKCFLYLSKMFKNNEKDINLFNPLDTSIVVIGGLGGRFDQVCLILNYLNFKGNGKFK